MLYPDHQFVPSEWPCPSPERVGADPQMPPDRAAWCPKRYNLICPESASQNGPCLVQGAGPWGPLVIFVGLQTPSHNAMLKCWVDSVISFTFGFGRTHRNQEIEGYNVIYLYPIIYRICMVNNGVCKNPNLALLSSFCIYVGANTCLPTFMPTSRRNWPYWCSTKNLRDMGHFDGMACDFLWIPSIFGARFKLISVAINMLELCNQVR